MYEKEEVLTKEGGGRTGEKETRSPIKPPGDQVEG